MNNCLLLVPVFPGNYGVLIPGNPGIRTAGNPGKREPGNENTSGNAMPLFRQPATYCVQLLTLNVSRSVFVMNKFISFFRPLHRIFELETHILYRHMSYTLNTRHDVLLKGYMLKKSTLVFTDVSLRHCAEFSSICMVKVRSCY